MTLQFSKYQGTGNDFVVIDNRDLFFPKDDSELVAKLCDRRFGVGADGLLLLENDETLDFSMVYYNSDGKLGTMCGNGGRCLVAFAKHLGVIEKNTSFKAVDGLHKATISDGVVSLHMVNVTEIKEKPSSCFLNTGSPHHVQIVENLADFEVNREGAKLRYGVYGATGSNINFVEQQQANIFEVRTYERGVENETLSCGTGVTAVAIAMFHSGKTEGNEIKIRTKGGELKVRFDFDQHDKIYKNVELVGPATLVFKGEITC